MDEISTPRKSKRKQKGVGKKKSPFFKVKNSPSDLTWKQSDGKTQNIVSRLIYKYTPEIKNPLEKFGKGLVKKPKGLLSFIPLFLQ